jgi:hypothetical protein
MSKFSSFMELWRAVDAHNGRDLEAQNGEAWRLKMNHWMGL